MCCCGKWSEWSKKTSQIINIFIIHPRVWQSSGFCFLPVLIAGRIAVSTALGDSRGGGTAPRRLARFERGSWMLRMAIWGSHHLGPCSWFQKKERGDSLSTSFNCLFCKVVPQEIGLMADTKIISQLCNRMRHRCHNAPSDPVFTTSAKLSNLNWLVVMTPTDFPNIMNFQDDFAQFVQDRGRVRMGQVSWCWASPSTVDLGNINLLDTACSANRKLPMDVRI